MGKIGKTLALLLTLTIAVSALTLLTVKPINAQTIPKPTIPEFTVTLASNPYDVAPITTTDPYTGETVITQAGYHNENRSILISIKNQQFTAFKDSNGNRIVLSYNISSRGHYSDDWSYYTNALWKTPLITSNGEYTVTSFGYTYDENNPYTYLTNIPENGKVDFRVEGLIGYFNETITRYPVPGGEFHRLDFIGESSGWSNTQTISIPDGSVSSSTPNPSPTVPELSWWVTVPLLLSIVAVAVMLKHLPEQPKGENYLS
jgi:hypothetical protein